MPTTVTPHITCRNAVEAIEFYGRAFGATTLMVMKSPDGQLMHGAIAIDGAVVMLAEEFPDWGSVSPLTLGNSPVTLHVNVPDVDAFVAKAAEAGCQVLMPPADQFWGDRYGQISDPYGHKWSIATTIKELTPEEMQAAAAEAFASGAGCGEA